MSEKEDDAEEIGAIDPVCKMAVKPSRAAASQSFAGSTYYFCNPGCKSKFAANPQAYLLENENKSAKAAELGFDKLAVKQDKLRTFYLPASALSYNCPMHPEVQNNEQGSCPICGMELEQVIKGSSGDTESSELKDLKNRIFPSALLTAILLALTMPQMFGAPKFISEQWTGYVQLSLALPVVLYGGAQIFSKALSSAKQGHMNMFTLIAFGVAISFVLSLVFMIFPAPDASKMTNAAHQMGKMLYFESAASIVTLVLLGQILELRSRESSSKSLEHILALAPRKARRELSKNQTEEIAVFEVQKGDRLRIVAGEIIPADGTILSGKSNVDESLLTGNSLPVSKTEGEKVYAGTINGEGSLLIIADSFGRDTVFAQIINLLCQAQRSRSPMQDLADRASSLFIPSVLAIAACTFAGWLLWGEPGMRLAHAIQDTVAVLVIACPCALGLATPVAVSLAVARAAKLGLLVKDSRALELLARATDLLIDKTGTLTKGRFEILTIVAQEQSTQDEILTWTASLEQESKHPIAQSICNKARSKGLDLQAPSAVKNSAGLGIEGRVAGQQLSVGNAEFMKKNAVDLDAIQPPDSPEFRSATLVYLSIDNKLKGIIVLADCLKDEAQGFISELRKLSVRPRILSGDNKDSVSATGQTLSIAEEDLAWGLLPQGKVELLKQLQAEGKTVAMLGDGVNDAAALSVADAGIAMSTGSDVALSSAAITVNHADLQAVPLGIKLGRLMVATMKENLFLAFIYNCVAILLATGILYPSLGIELNPAIAAAAMSLSSLSVILNSMKITKARL